MICYSQLGRSGRFGNCLFQIAGTIGIAIKSGQPYSFPKFIVHDMADRFGSTEDNEVYKYMMNQLPEMDTTLRYQQYGYFWEYRDIKLPSGNWDMSPSHFQSVKYFEHCMDKIRFYFTFTDEYPQNDYVAVHYRAGDYDPEQTSYHPRCSLKYYEQAIKRFPQGTEFLIFSDDIEEAYKLFRFLFPNMGMKVLFSDQRHYLDSFKLMKSCKSFICANSSFSHMAALLGTHPDKKIIMPSHWFGAAANGLSFDTLYPLNAIII